MRDRTVVGWIEDYIWEQIHSLVPIVCVDLVILHRGSVLLLKRSVEPEAGKWALPGGRLWKNEDPVDACWRLMGAELGWESRNQIGAPDSLGWMSNRYDTSPWHEDSGTHTISLVYRVKVEDDAEIPVRVDGNHSDFIWWDGKEGSLSGVAESHKRYIRSGLELPELAHEENDIEKAVMRNANGL